MCLWNVGETRWRRLLENFVDWKIEGNPLKQWMSCVVTSVAIVIQYLNDDMIGKKTKIECRLKHSQALLQRTFAQVYHLLSTLFHHVDNEDCTQDIYFNYLSQIYGYVCKRFLWLSFKISCEIENLS